MRDAFYIFVILSLLAYSAVQTDTYLTEEVAQ